MDASLVEINRLNIGLLKLLSAETLENLGYFGSGKNSGLLQLRGERMVRKESARRPLLLRKQPAIAFLGVAVSKSPRIIPFH
jgi:hypothetical protein